VTQVKECFIDYAEVDEEFLTAIPNSIFRYAAIMPLDYEISRRCQSKICILYIYRTIGIFITLSIYGKDSSIVSIVVKNYVAHTLQLVFSALFDALVCSIFYSF